MVPGLWRPCWHLARQLGFRDYSRESEALTDTLRFFLRPLEEFLRVWPPRPSHDELVRLAQLATDGLDALSLLGILLGGPPRWAAKAIPGCKVRTLESHLRPLVVAALVGAVGDMLGRWEQVDVRKVRELREERIKASERPEVAAPASERRRPQIAQELADLRRDNASAYTPPPPGVGRGVSVHSLPDQR